MDTAIARGLSALDVPGLVSVYLFGSHAQGRAHRESDVDLGLILDRRRFPTRRSRSNALVDLTSQLIGLLHENRIDVVILNDAPPVLARRIVTEGRRIFCADHSTDHAFVRDAQLRAADVEPFLRRTRAVKLAALAR